MTTETMTTLERKLLPIAGNPRRPREFLLIDMKDGMLRGAFWRMRTPVDRPGVNEPGQSLVDQLAGDVLPEGSRKAGWWRVACERDRLEDLLYVLLNDSRHDPRAMELYVRATGWGQRLP